RHQHRRDHPLPGPGRADPRRPAEGRPDQLRAGRPRPGGRAGRRDGGRSGRGGGALMPAAAEPLILIVEAEADLVTLIAYNLERAGFRTVAARDGDEALLLAAEQRPDLVVLDWMLPLRSGLDICRQLRRAPATRDVPIIMLTARGEEADRVRGLESG